MEIKEFIHNFAIQFDDTEESEFNSETNFRELDEWSSLVSLAILNMIEKKYTVIVKSDEIKMVNTINELYNLVKSK